MKKMRQAKIPAFDFILKMLKDKNKKSTNFEKITINPLSKKDFSSLLVIEEKIYPKLLVQGKAILQDIESGRGLEYSFVAFVGKKNIGYLVAVEEKSKEGGQIVYLEDIAVLPEAQGHGVAWEMLKKLIRKLQAKAKRDNEPILWEMHLREASRNLFEKHKKELEEIGVEGIKEIILPRYYKNGEDASYRLYKVFKRL